METALTSSSDDDSRPASIGGLGLLLARENAPLINPQAMLSFTSREQWSPVHMLIFCDCYLAVCMQWTELASSHLCVRAL